MATQIHNNEPHLTALCAAHNALKAQIGAGASVHNDVSEVVPSSPSATDLPSSIVRLQNLIGVYDFHIADAIAHLAVDGTNTLAYTVASCAAPTSGDGGLASAIAAANDLKSKYNSHCASTAAHANADSTNTSATANATNLSTLETLVNALYTKITAHLAGANAPTGVAPGLRLIKA